MSNFRNDSNRNMSMAAKSLYQDGMDSDSKRLGHSTDLDEVILKPIQIELGTSSLFNMQKMDETDRKIQKYRKMIHSRHDKQEAQRQYELRQKEMMMLALNKQVT